MTAPTSLAAAADRLALVAASSPAQAATPTNDAFSAAKVFGVAVPTTGWEGTTTLTGTTTKATTQTGEPTPSCVKSRAKSVWFSVKPRRSGVLRLSTAGSAFDIVLAVYRGSAVTGLSRVGCANKPGGTEKLDVSVKANSTYVVQLAGTGTSTSGAYRLTAKLRYFGPGFRPAGSWRAYSSSSPFNRALPATPALASNSSQIIDRVISKVPYGTPAGGIARRDQPAHFLTHTDGSSGEPTYFSPPPSSGSTATYTLRCTYSIKWGTCPVEGTKIRIPGRRGDRRETRPRPTPAPGRTTPTGRRPP